MIIDKQSPRADLGNSKRRTITDALINSALVIATIICTLLTIEISLRLYHRDWEFTNLRYRQESKFTGYHIYDAELGWVPRPQRANVWGLTVTILNGGIRSNGNENVWDGTGEPILAVGDSYTFGDQVADSQTWPAQLEKLSGRRVINAGVDGYGVDQAFLRAQRLLDRYRFSTVIFSFIPDDIRRSQMSVMFATAKPYFDFKERRLTLENVPVPPPSFNPKRENLLLGALEHSRFVDAVMKRLFPQWWLRGASERQVQDNAQAIKVACALLHKLESLTKAQHSALIILAQHWELEPASDAREAADVLQCLSDTRIHILDLHPALAKLKTQDPSAHDRLFNPNRHMSAEGNQFVARELLPIVTDSREH